MQTQGILLVKDAILLTNFCSTNRGYFVPTSTSVNPRYFNTGAKPGEWYLRRDQLVIRLDEYSDTLIRNLQRFLEIGDNRGAEVIQRSCVTCLAHLAVLCDLTSGLEPNSKPQMDAICDSSLERLSHLARSMRIDRYTYLDILLGVRPCITRADAERLTKALSSFRGSDL